MTRPLASLGRFVASLPAAAGNNLGLCGYLNQVHMVGERSVGLRRWGVNPAGDIRSANADMSSDKACEKHARRKPKVSCATFIGAG